MENKILDLLEKMNDRQERMEEKLERMDDRQHKMEERFAGMEDKLERIDERQHNMEDKIDQVFDTVKRIEVSQKDDVMGLLKLQKKNLDFEVDYINNRLTEMDKRLFNLEKRVEN